MRSWNSPKLIHYSIGLVVIVEGLDKFFNLLVDWQIYIAPLISDLWPFSNQVFLYCLGVIEILFGVIFLLRCQLGAWLVAGLMIGIIFDLVLLNYYYNMILLNGVIGLTAFSYRNSSQAIDKV